MASAQVAHHAEDNFDEFTSFLWEHIETDDKIEDFTQAAKAHNFRANDRAHEDKKYLLLYISKALTVNTTQNAVKQIMEKIGYDYNQLYTDFRKAKQREAHAASDTASPTSSLKGSITKEGSCPFHDKIRNLYCKDCIAILCNVCIKEGHTDHDWEVWSPDENADMAENRVKEQLAKCAALQRQFLRLNEDFNAEHEENLTKIDKARKKAISEIERNTNIVKQDCDTHYKALTEGIGNTLETLKSHETRLKEVQTRLSQKDASAVGDALSGSCFSEIAKIKSSFNDMSLQKLAFVEDVALPSDVPGKLSRAQEPCEGEPIEWKRAESRLSISSESENFPYKKKFLPVKAYVSVMRPAGNNAIYFKNHHKSKVTVLSEEGEGESTNLQSLTAGDVHPYKGLFIFADFEKKQICQISPRSPQIRVLYKSAAHIPLGISISDERDELYVGFSESFEYKLKENSRRYVKVFSVQKTEVKEKKKIFEKDKREQRLLNYPYRLAYNHINTSICIVDQTSKETGRVIVLDADCPEVVVGTYAPTSSFDPRGIFVNVSGEILVTDTNNHALHLLDQSACVLRILFDNTSGMQLPRTVVVNEGNLWIGCKSGHIYLLKY